MASSHLSNRNLLAVFLCYNESCMRAYCIPEFSKQNYNCKYTQIYKIKTSQNKKYKMKHDSNGIFLGMQVSYCDSNSSTVVILLIQDRSEVIKQHF